MENTMKKLLLLALVSTVPGVRANDFADKLAMGSCTIISGLLYGSLVSACAYFIKNHGLPATFEKLAAVMRTGSIAALPFFGARAVMDMNIKESEIILIAATLSAFAAGFLEKNLQTPPQRRTVAPQGRKRVTGRSTSPSCVTDR